IQRAHQELPEALEGIRGRYYDAKDSQDLGRYLSGMLLRMQFLIDADYSRSTAKLGFDRRPVAVSISRSDDVNLRWAEGLDPGDCTVSVPSIRGLRQRVHLEAGDSLVLDLTSRDGTPELSRSMYALSDAIRRRHLSPIPPRKEGEWLLAVLQNHQTRAGGRL